jgi:hypothetical protein
MKGKRKHLVIVCLLVSVLMAGAIVLQGCKESDSVSDTEQETKKWTCPKHPNIIDDRPVKCPTCGMDLVPLEEEKETE